MRNLNKKFAVEFTVTKTVIFHDLKFKQAIEMNQGEWEQILSILSRECDCLSREIGKKLTFQHTVSEIYLTAPGKMFRFTNAAFLQAVCYIERRRH